LSVVEGTGVEPYCLTISFDKNGWPDSDCSCPFDWEPLCKHAVATLLAWRHQEGDDTEPLKESKAHDDLPSSDDPVRRERYLGEIARVETEARRAAARDQKIKILARPSLGVLGQYRVASGDGDRFYVVTVRDDRWAYASCSCPDFQVNELGLCKHIERVKLALNKKSLLEKLRVDTKNDKTMSLYRAPRPSHAGEVQPLGDLRLYIPPALVEKVGPLIQGSPFKTFVDPRGLSSAENSPVGMGGFIQDGRGPEVHQRFIQTLVRQLKEQGNVEVDPEVFAYLDRAVVAERWEKKINALAQDPQSHAVWQQSVGALKINLHPYQVQGILFAVAKRRAFLGDDMGLGKTVQGIGAAVFLKSLGVAKRALVVCPASLKFQWKREIERLSGESVCLVAGPAKERDRLYREDKSFFHLINYELLHRDLPVLKRAADLIVLDEAQRVKNWNTRVAKTVKSLEAPFRLVLTGTPMENRLTELHSIAEFLDPRALGPAWKLIPSYARFDADDRIAGYVRLDHLRSRLNRFFLRRTRPEVMAQLPKRTDNIFWTTLLKSQEAVHMELQGVVAQIIARWKRFKRLSPEDHKRLMLLLNGMRVVSNAYGQYDWGTIEKPILAAEEMTPLLWKKIGSPKLEEFRRVLGDLLDVKDQKVVVFSQWERMLRLSELVGRGVLKERGASSVVFHGGIPQKKRGAEIQRFLEDPSARVFYSTDAGSLGLNLQSTANCVVNLEIPWNPAVLEQRIGRVHRQGQKKSVEVINLVTQGSIEERIYHLLGQKKALFAGLFSNEKEITFTPLQASSFMDKVQKLMGEQATVPSPVENGSPGSSEPAGVVQAALDTVAKSPASPVPPPTVETPIDLNPFLKTVAGLFGISDGVLPTLDPLRLSRTEAGLTVSVPPSLEKLLQSCGPLVKALAEKITQR